MVETLTTPNRLNTPPGLSGVQRSLGAMFGKKKPKENPQDQAIRDLAARTVKFDRSDELVNTLFSAGGGYVENVKDDDLRAALYLFGHLKNQGSIQVVGYLVPVGEGIEIQVNGLTVDRLTKSAVKKVSTKVSGPTPVKIEVAVIEGRKPGDDRPHLKLIKHNTPPKN